MEKGDWVLLIFPVLFIILCIYIIVDSIVWAINYHYSPNSYCVEKYKGSASTVEARCLKFSNEF